MNMAQAFPSQYIRSADIPPEGLTLTMGGMVDPTTNKEVAVVQEEVGMDKNVKPVLYFRDWKQGMVLNRVNCETICRVYGYESDEWVGKKICLTVAEVEFRGRTVPAIRVRDPRVRAVRPSAPAAGGEAPAAAPQKQGGARPAGSTATARGVRASELPYESEDEEDPLAEES
jgi:hypothetical protein